LIRLTNCLGKKAGFENIYIHIDAKSKFANEDLTQEIKGNANVISMYRVYWGGYNQLLSILSLLRTALSKKKYDHIILLSGQDLPVVSFNRLLDFFDQNPARSFIQSDKFPMSTWNYNNGFGRVQWYWFMDYSSRIKGVHAFHRWSHRFYNKFNLTRASSRGMDFYGGSDWWMLPGNVAEYCLKVFDQNRKIRKCFRYSFIPTEMFFQTVIGNSGFRETTTGNNHRFIPWGDDNTGHPGVVQKQHRDKIEAGDYLFARKFELQSDPELFEYFENKF